MQTFLDYAAQKYFEGDPIRSLVKETSISFSLFKMASTFFEMASVMVFS